MNFYKNPHFKSIASGKEPPEKTGCEGCHGPAQKHVAAGGGKATIPRAFSLMTAEAGPGYLPGLSCARPVEGQHPAIGTYAERRCVQQLATRSTIRRRRNICWRKSRSELCYGCHATVFAQFSMPSKHRVNEGFMQCTDCHNPHGSFDATWRMAQRPRMVERVLNAESPCVKCHTDKRGPFVFEHPPVRVEGCEICHMPHGSMNPKLLRRPVVFTSAWSATTAPIRSARAITAYPFNLPDTTCSIRNSRNAPPATWPFTDLTATVFPEVDAMKTRFWIFFAAIGALSAQQVVAPTTPEAIGSPRGENHGELQLHEYLRVRIPLESWWAATTASIAAP